MTVRSPRHAPARPPVAPIHRGPQAVSQITAQYSAAIQHAPNAALLIDFDNVTMGIRSDLAVELRNLLSSDIIKGKVAVQRAYADWRRYPQYIVPLAESSIDMIMAPAYGSSKKNATDIRLAVDAIELVFTRPEIGTYILLSGDSDFASLVTKLKEYGKYVIGVGIRESSSDLLVMNCDEYYSYNALAGLVKQSEEDVQKWDPWVLVGEAIGRMKKNGDVMRSDRLKQVMQDIDASFDEKNYGYSKFSKFVSDAAEKGLVTITKLENGQLEVGPVNGSPAAATSAEPVRRPESGAAEGEAPAREERSGRRGRRGGRGRGRDREDRGERAERPLDVGSASPARSDDAGIAATPEAVAEAPSAPDVTDALVATPAPREHAPRHHERGDRTHPRTDSRTDSRSESRTESRDDIGRSGERLTRQEAFDLVKRATASVVTGDDAAPAQIVRAKAFELLGRDSESLSERNFERILRDSHDQEVIDLRRRGNDFEVALPASVAPVSEQLNRAAAAHSAAVAAATPPAPVAPRGMGPRGVPVRGGRPTGRGAALPPPELFLVGVVDDVAPAAASAVAVTETADVAPVAAAEGQPKEKARGSRGRGKAAAKSSDASAGGDESAPRRTAAKGAKPATTKEGKPKARGGRGGGGARAKKPAAT